ncbi:MAG: pentapeptide repeat-containing protein [Microcoleus sp. PH2017_10_PVI_O_A]|uniref:pentapeptide repeat-containing protein n=1 Tax=unclassified Microcoleus TaxID=2642155 RepID=UPI001E0F45E1|nr:MULTISPECIES: pentapeptide repeat-containing protein [unclassified Microcoleus]TAE85944.1 MAG: hypothetical protein EAZ83_00965 [Oscillatoriales cyanobacterium]MCC3404059.1 pentapeptide repeat-containing protein [Microcoleus sp. PH2017_10_PVI_O_A]MCC3458142.1 pentapeptide repeat-containing protein [Microcoleus sp. PH2017_11_PCY_U_A]MCC3476564.1 pentapeptide repeat-containing protein [Microcoleus sp. PH2017_12_PCY_D_A]MCC3527096.1 pentapeptide repeat-containing protein [Microcoleus sp. PH201
MSETELDLVSIATRVLQLEEEQVILKKYIAKLKRQLEAQEQRFNDRPEPQMLESLMAEIASLQQPCDLGNGHMSVIADRQIELDTETEKQKSDFQYQLVCDRPNSRAVLMEALSLAQERLIIVCPWLNCNSINDELLQKFRDCLNRGCLINIGWGYLGDRQKIGKGWRYNALADLQELASEYPGQFSLTLLGTHENYLVCDSIFAMLGSHNFLTNSDQSAEKEVGIRTDDCQIIKALIERFDSSEVLDEEEIERRFVATSDYLNRADYLEGLAADSEDIALEDSCEDVEDESEECREPVVSVEEFVRRYSEGEKDFTGINLAGADLRGKNLASGVNLSNANLNKANLNGVTWQAVNLSGAILKGADMREARFDGTNFSLANLCGVNLYKASLSSANLNQANLVNANLSQANLSSANLNQANLVNANLSQANLQSAKLEQAKLRKAILRAAQLQYASFSEADLNSANLSGSKLTQQTKFTTANLSQANLSGLYLRKTDLNNADLTNANLSNSNLLEANIDRANLKGVQLEGAIYNQATLFPTDFDPVKAGACLIAPYVSLQNADLTGRDLSSVNLMGANLQDANLISAQLNNSNLRDANLSGAKLQGARLDGCNLSRANLKQVNLNDARLVSADLTTADLTEADLRQAELNSAKLRGADLISADLRAANLSYADLSGANLTAAKIGGANLENAKLTGAIMPDGSTHE